MVFDGVVTVRSEMDVSSAMLLQKSQGEQVCGIRRGGWIQLTREPGFMVIVGPTTGNTLLRVVPQVVLDAGVEGVGKAPLVIAAGIEDVSEITGGLGVDEPGKSVEVEARTGGLPRPPEDTGGELALGHSSTVEHDTKALE